MSVTLIVNSNIIPYHISSLSQIFEETRVKLKYSRRMDPICGTDSVSSSYLRSILLSSKERIMDQIPDHHGSRNPPSLSSDQVTMCRCTFACAINSLQSNVLNTNQEQTRDHCYPKRSNFMVRPYKTF